MAPSEQHGSTTASACPEFPSDVPTAGLLRISLSKLKAQDTEEVGRFIQACKELGFFYLDLSDDNEGTNLLEDANKLFALGEDLFKLPVEEKQKYDFAKQKTYFGYKGLGAHMVDRQGNLDANEFYNKVSKDDVLEHGKRWPAPACLDTQRPLLRSFTTEAHAIVILVLDLLSDHFQLPPGTLRDMHRINGKAGDQVRFIHSPPQPPDDSRTALGEHTDFGSVTVLFNRVGGLQVLPPGRGAEWCYVRPLPGHAIINLGDAMVKFTNGVLRSNIHRVVAPPGAQAAHTRYSLVYFSRPEDEVLLRRLPGSDLIPALPEGVEEEVINSRDWVLRRGLGPRLAMNSSLDFDKFRGTEAISQRV